MQNHVNATPAPKRDARRAIVIEVLGYSNVGI